MADLITVPLTCLVLTLDEEQNIETCLRSLTPAQQVIVVDCGSSDLTCEMAREAGATVVFHPWPGYAAQRNWAMVCAEVAHEWILFVDADEQVPLDSWIEIADFVASPGSAVAGDFRRQVYLFGRLLRHGGFSTARVVRLIRPDRCRYLERPVHEHAVVSGRTHSFRVPLVHHDHRTFEAWLARHNEYSTLEAQARMTPLADVETRRVSGPRVKDWIRQRIWKHLPAKPLLFFFYVYVLRGGFLDGRAGLRIATLYGFQELAVQLKIEELRTPRGS